MSLERIARVCSYSILTWLKFIAIVLAVGILQVTVPKPYTDWATGAVACLAIPLVLQKLWFTIKEIRRDFRDS